MTDTQQTVYVVEDDEAVRDSLELLLKSDGKPVKTYDNANAFLKDYSKNGRLYRTGYPHAGHGWYGAPEETE